jgi:hypothetical protein
VASRQLTKTVPDARLHRGDAAPCQGKNTEDSPDVLPDRSVDQNTSAGQLGEAPLTARDIL